MASKVDEKSSVEISLSQLKSDRGYIKATITRIYQQTLEKPDGDIEDVSKVEDKFYSALAYLQEIIDSFNSKMESPNETIKHSVNHKRNVILPVISIESYNGKSCSQYVTFINMFNSLVHNDNALDSVQKLHYLRSFLKDEAYNLVKDLPITNSSYLEALTLLNDRYYNKHKITSEHIISLLDLPMLTRGGNIREFVSTIKQAIASLKNLSLSVDSWDPMLIVVLTRKLDQYTGRSFQLERDVTKEPTVTELLSFLEKIALANENIEPSSATTHGKSAPKVAVHVAVQQRSCINCKSETHKLFSCKQFQLMPSALRIKFVKDNKLCEICLNSHKAKCKFHFRCTHCKKNHNSLIHPDEDKQQTASPVSLFSNNNNNINTNVLLPTARIKLYSRDNREVHVKAILDSGSQASLVTSKVINVLGLTPMQANINIIGISNTLNNIKYAIPLEVHSMTSNYKTIVNFHVVDTITCKLPHQPIDLSSLNLPVGLEFADSNFNTPSEINMLMGADVFFQVVLSAIPATAEACTSPRVHSMLHEHVTPRTPALINTKLGVVVAGNLPTHFSNAAKKVSLLCYTCETDVNNTLKQFWQTENVPQLINEKCSEYELAESIFTSSVKLEDNRFTVDLPLKIPLEDVNQILGVSFDLALFRFLNLEKRLQKNTHLLSQYDKFIEEYIRLGHGHYVDINSYNFSVDPVYFLAHHAVFNESSKTTPLRVVFDGSMLTNKKISLNDILLNGPKVQRDLFDILLLYRFGDYAFSTDIKKMFRNIHVNPAHKSLQNILWRNNPLEPIRCICLDTVTYGLKPSSYLATRCLHELATRYEQEWPLASFALKNCTYVDDVLYSHSDLHTLIETKRQLCELLKLGGFETHKWSSNNMDFLSDIPTDKQQFHDLDFQQDCNIKTLGLTFNLKSDRFIIASPHIDTSQIITKSSILSCISRFYDPLGFVTPIIVKAKAIMQRLWADKVDWNSEPSKEIRHDWLQFTKNLACMNPIHLDRNIPITATATALQLIGFADASSATGYGCCLYLRVTYETGNPKLFLLCSKSRINPRSSPLTVPKLELNAALLLAKLTNKVHSVLSIKVKIDDIFLFSDSKIVLAWQNTDLMKLQAYVANRVRMINELTCGWKWLYVRSQENPADLISRGMEPQELHSCAIWWSGPEFLQQREYDFSKNKVHLPIEDLPELKTTPITSSSTDVVLLMSKGNDFLQSYISRYSDINKMMRILAYILRYRDNLILRTKDKNSKIELNALSVKELQRALLVIIKYDQSVHLINEINSLQSGKAITGSLLPLHPFLDNEGILRVGGRLQNSNISYSKKHPIILVKGSKITELIIRSEHVRLLHAGPKLMLSTINQKYWIINGIREIKKVTHKCITCFRMKATASRQFMGSLPRDRVVKSVRAFQKVGIDFAGPVNVKLSRVRKSVVGKGYICVFVCFSTKAIHLELASDLSTATFLACFKRFISRRGLPSDCYSDNASTFRCASSQLSELYKLFSSKDHQSQVNNYVTHNQINFHRIPSYSPVFGGLWESAVKSTKYHLKRSVQKAILTYEELNTVLVRIEAVLNSRPLVPMTSNCDDFTYLTPGHFLIGTALTDYPEHDVSDVPVGKLRMWNLCKHMVQSFWKIWYRQYLNVLQCRPKWRKEYGNITVGTLVILVEQNTPVMNWPMARVVRVFPGKDNCVRAFEVMTPNRKTHIRSVTKVCVLPLE